TLHIRVRRYKCIECGHVWRQDTTAAAPPRAKISRSGLDWALRALVVDHDTVSVIADKLAVSWHTANSAVLAEGHRLLINDPNRFDGVSVIGVDEHVWRHTRRGDKYVTVIIDLTPISQGHRPGTVARHGARHGCSTWCPARLLDMVPGRSKQVFKQWLKARPKDWRECIDVVAMDGFSGFKTASVEELPDAV
ncbi:transposase, partial [Brevibacterium sp. ZH18]|uniref:transposase n=1 Tax=Brevibacterium sp. ZH18 TaxID=2927784 RepID=UPI001F6214AA